MLGVIVLFLLLSSGSIFGSAVCRLRFEETLPLTSTGIVAILFISGLLNQLYAGLFVACAVLMLLVLCSIICIVRKGGMLLFCKRFFTPGFFLFTAMYLLLFLLHYGRVANEWDEFSHWMDIVKAMFILDDFGTNPLSCSLFESYPPGMSLFQYFVQKLMYTIGETDSFTEWLCYFAYHIYTFSFLFPFLTGLKFRNWGPCIFFVVGVCLAPIVFFPSFLDSTYIDPFVGLTAGCGAAMLYLNRRKTASLYLYMFSVMFALVLAKDIGMMFAVFLAAAALIDEAILVAKNLHQERSSLRRLVWITFGVLASILVPKMLWELHLNITDVPRRFSDPIDPVQLINIFFGDDQSYRKTVLLNYLRTVLVDGFALMNESLYLTLPVLCLLLFAGLFGLHDAHQRLSSCCRPSRSMLLWIVVLQTCAYLIGLCVIYMFKFPEHEAVSLASFSRYCGIALLAVQMFAVLLAFSYLLKVTKNWLCLLLTAVSFSLIPGDNLLMFINRSSVHIALNAQAPYKQTAAQTLDTIGTDNEKVYIVSQGSKGYDYLILKFNLRPSLANEDGWSLSASGPLYQDDVWTKTVSAEEWQEQLEAFDYVLINKTNDTFAEDYGMLFESPEDIRNQTLFRINHETGLLSLVQQN